jgi:hypothetical protein
MNSEVSAKAFTGRPSPLTRRAARAVIAALDPDKFPVLTSQMDVIADSLAERDVFRLGLRDLITAAAKSLGIDDE